MRRIPTAPKGSAALCNGLIKNMHNQDCDLNIDQLKGKVLFLMSSDLDSDLCQLGAEGARCYILMIITVQKNWVLNHAGVSFYFQPQQFSGRGQSDAATAAIRCGYFGHQLKIGLSRMNPINALKIFYKIPFYSQRGTR